MRPFNGNCASTPVLSRILRDERNDLIILLSVEDRAPPSGSTPQRRDRKGDVWNTRWLFWE